MQTCTAEALSLESGRVGAACAEERSDTSMDGMQQTDEARAGSSDVCGQRRPPSKRRGSAKALPARVSIRLQGEEAKDKQDSMFRYMFPNRVRPRRRSLTGPSANGRQPQAVPKLSTRTSQVPCSAGGRSLPRCTHHLSLDRASEDGYFGTKPQPGASCPSAPPRVERCALRIHQCGCWHQPPLRL